MQRAWAEGILGRLYCDIKSQLLRPGFIPVLSDSDSRCNLGNAGEPRGQGSQIYSLISENRYEKLFNLLW